MWETFLTQTYKESYPFFQSWNWGEVLQSVGTSIERLGLYDADILVGVLLVVDVKAKRGHYLYLRHGPVLINFEKYGDSFLNHVKIIAKEKGASFIRISRLLKKDTITVDFFKQRKFLLSALQTIDTEVCWILDITKSEEELLREMRKTHRYLIKKAKSMPIEIIKTTDTKYLPEFLSLYKDLSKRKHFVPHKEVEKEFEIFTKDNQSMLFLAKYEGKIISGAIIDFVGDMAIYRHGASSYEYRNIPAAYLVQWEAILEAKERGKKIYNFWGIAPENAKNHPWQGHTLFKTGFGGEREFYIPTMDLPLSISYWKNYIIDWISKMRKR